MHRQTLQLLGMPKRQRKFGKAVCNDGHAQRFDDPKAAPGDLDRQFPAGDRADPHNVSAGDGTTGFASKASIVPDPPDQYVTVEQDLQNSSSSLAPSSKAAMRSGIGASKSFDIQILPFN